MNSNTRSKLRSLANTIKPLVSMGKEGLSENIIYETQNVLFHHELIKVNVLKASPVTAKEAADTLAEKTFSEVVQVMGSKITLYKYSDKEDIKHVLA